LIRETRYLFCLLLIGIFKTGTMKLIKLTQGKFAQVDDEDYKFLNQFKWDCRFIGNTYYTVTLLWDPVLNKGIKVYMHRLIMKFPTKLVIDHIDHNGLNNQKSNLRICTHRQNMLNSAKRKSGKTSKYIGVYIDKRGYIIGCVSMNNKTKYIGKFETEEDAARARDREVIKDPDGRYCILNFNDQNIS
jgi:hypothetical protein